MEDTQSKIDQSMSQHDGQNNSEDRIDQASDSDQQTKKILKNKQTSMNKTKPSAIALRQVRKNLKKFISVLESAHKKDINESDTSNIINDMLGDVLGYDKFFDVTTEYKIRGQYADYGIRIKDKIHAFIEVKAINIALNSHHLFQVSSYAVHEGVDWAILTNGNVWQLYRIEDTKPVRLALVLAVDLFDKTKKFPEKCLDFVAFHKRSMTSSYIVDLWKEKTCVNPDTIKKIISSKEGIEFVRKQIKRQSGYKVTTEQIRAILSTEILTN